MSAVRTGVASLCGRAGKSGLYGCCQARQEGVGAVNPHNGRVQLCGVAIDPLSMDDVVLRVESAISTSCRLAISVINVAKLVNMQHDRLLRESVEAGDLIVADGMPLVWLSRLKGKPLPERVAGIDLMYRLFELADRKALRVFLLGARADTLDRVVDIARDRYPRMIVAGWRDGYFTADQEEEVARAVAEAKPDILLVAMTSPKKELFMNRWGGFMNVPVVHGVGGSFDVMAGVARRAPRWMQRAGLEWFYRVVQEPRRMWKRYLVTNTMFMGLALGDLLNGRREAPPPA
jgi:N-acetylglucosaminyldiphosphoundecaprenol N-acetyl-beta-D-mannosaminyltransferase